MEKMNRNLGIAFLVLLVLSVLAFREQASRGERFERGQKFLPSLDLDNVATIEIQEGAESVTLKRSGDTFTIQQLHGYRAKNEAVNRFLRQVLDVELEKRVGRGEDLQKELGIEPPGESTVSVAFKNADGQEMVRLRIGETTEDGSAQFIQRLDRPDEPIYLTQGTVFLSTDAESFLQKEVLNVSSDQVTRIEGPDFVLAKPTTEEGAEEAAEEAAGDALDSASLAGDSLVLAEAGPGESADPAAVSRARSALANLNFDKVYLADDPQVRGLAFAPGLRLFLGDSTGYAISLAQRDERHFLRIEGFSTVDRVEIGMEESEEELKEKADVLTKAEEVQEFNAYHGSWVYEIPESTAEKLALTRQDVTG